MRKIGLFGVGHLGKIHLRLLKEIDNWDLLGFYDHDPKVAEAVSEQFDVPAFESVEALIAAVDAVDIVTPTLSHFRLAERAIEAGKHVFIEKPLSHTLEEGKALLEMQAANPDLIIQVGHVERFNPAFLSVSDREIQPRFIEGHRLAPYNPRGTDVSVVLDLMIHDLDIVLSLVRSPIKEISASGVSVISDTPDIANARIVFQNGCVANLTASRISIKQMRRLRFFQKNNYLAVDFLKKESEVFRLEEALDQEAIESQTALPLDTGKETKYLVFERPESRGVNAIKMELEEFAASIMEGASIRVSLQDGYNALEAAHMILERINTNAKEAIDPQAS
ncbi:MAG: Gfo/Idh/MocA family oxidoreductase [Bacteroidota bacterium]